SVATYDGTKVTQAKKLLTVKPGERGLRQSDAVFQHTVNMPQLCTQLELCVPKAVGVSNRPRNVDGSYMPCFLVGENVAAVLSRVNSFPLYKTSHQVGHILAALYSVNRLDLINQRFIAFHLSGGTTEALIVEPDDEEIIKASVVATSTDLKAGQAIDRTGVMLGLSFPCGKELDLLSQKSDRFFKLKPTMLGINCSLSGVENKVKNMIEKNEPDEDVARFALTYVAQSVSAMLKGVIEKYGNLPVVFSGGVASNTLLRKTINENFDAYFADSEFSLDNAAGIAIYAYLKDNE
ncbi:peptidase M22, partial [Eubacterium sp.]|uniref:peptidase M22 n=1 Tax=Eubacterium sp. TaxID=142586 RepID=UPI003EFEF0AC